MGICFSQTVNIKQIEIARNTAQLYMSMEHEDMYHNMEHIDDVVSFVRLVIASLRGKKKRRKSNTITRLENILIPAAYLHDLGHPMNEPRVILENMVYRKLKEKGQLLTETETNLATITMEDLHVALCKTECGDVIHSDMLPILELIKSTDLKTYTSDHNDLGKTIIRCADLSHVTFPWQKHKRSTRRLCKELNMSISPQCQIEFIESVVLPQFRLLDLLMKTPESKEWVGCVLDNLSMWKNHDSLSAVAVAVAVAASASAKSVSQVEFEDFI